MFSAQKPLSPQELKRVREANDVTAINVIEFKSGRDDGKRNFLNQLADENRGQYKRINVDSLSAVP